MYLLYICGILFMISRLRNRTRLVASCANLFCMHLEIGVFKNQMSDASRTAHFEK